MLPSSWFITLYCYLNTNPICLPVLLPTSPVKNFLKLQISLAFDCFTYEIVVCIISDLPHVLFIGQHNDFSLSFGRVDFKVISFREFTEIPRVPRFQVQCLVAQLCAHLNFQYDIGPVF